MCGSSKAAQGACRPAITNAVVVARDNAVEDFRVLVAHAVDAGKIPVLPGVADGKPGNPGIHAVEDDRIVLAAPVDHGRGGTAA